MSCGIREVRQRKPVWSDGTDGAANVVVAFHEGRTSEVSAVNIAMLIEGKSAQFRASRCLTYSNDGITWDTPATFGSYETTANTWLYPSTWETVSDSKAFFRVGVVGRNVATYTGNVEMATVSVRIGQKPR